jgi:protein-disulfide isomerase
MAQKRSKATRRTEANAAAQRAAEIRKEFEAKERRRRTLWISLAVLVVIAIVVAIGYGVQSSRDTTGKAGGAPQGAVNTYAVGIGKASAPVTVTVYEDFMCPFCGQFEASSRPWVQQYIDQGKLQMHYHALAFLDRNSNGTKYSTRAANALAVVLDTSGQAVTKKFHDLLFENQPAEGSNGLSDQQLIDLAVQAGADKSKVSGPIKDLEFEKWVVNGTDAASRHGVTGTPTIEIDGKTFKGYTSIQDISSSLKAAVDQKLASS